MGALSDRYDRRLILLAVTILAATADAVFILLAPTQAVLVLILAGGFSATIYAMYPVIVAHANDHAPPGDALRTSGGLLLVYGLGSIAGPLIAGVVMQGSGPQGLFITTFVAHLALIAFGALRIRARSAPADAEKVSFNPSPTAAQSTPQTLVLSPFIDAEPGATPPDRPAENPPNPG